MDLFDLLEKVFRGIVYFIYNVVETTWTILRHPIDGPRELTRRHRDPNARQIGGLTYLFLVLLPYQHWWIDLDASDRSSSLLDLLTDAFGSAPKLDSNAMWPDILAALIATVAIDAVLRLLLRWRLPTRRRLRQTRLSMSEYALAWLIAGQIAFLGLYQLVDPKGANEVEATSLIGLLLLVIVVISSAYPAAAAMLGAGTPAWRRVRKRRLKLGAAMAGMLMLFFVAAFSGSGFASETQEVRNSKQYFNQILRVQTLRCRLQPDGRLSAEGLMQQASGAPMTVEAGDLRLLPADSASGDTLWDALDPANRQGLEVGWQSGDPARFLVVKSGEPQLVEVVTEQPVGVPQYDACRLSVLVFGPSWDRNAAGGRIREKSNLAPIRPWALQGSAAGSASR